MSIENIVNWYEKNVNYRLTKAFLNFLIKTGIVKPDIDLEILNLYLLEREDGEFVFENNTFKIKKNRIPVITKFKDEAEKTPIPPKQEKKPIVTFTRGNNTKTEKKETKKFKLEIVGGNKMKLVKK
jgi:hypothetical protein